MRILARKQESSVRHLQALYSVVAGGALFKAVEALAADDGGIHFSHLPLFLSFLLVVIPFYHGALRHLDDTYLDEESPTPPNGALFADFVLLFIEGCILLLLAMSIQSVSRFPFVLLALLALDAFWAIVTHLVFSALPRHRLLTLKSLFLGGAANLRANLTWAVINMCASAVLGLYLVAAALSGVLDHWMWTVPFVVVFNAVRSAVDYRKSWSFYFPVLGAEERSLQALEKSDHRGHDPRRS